MANPTLRDHSGRLHIGPGHDVECSAPIVTDSATGRVVGVYIDDTTPNIDHWVMVAVAKYGPTGGLVFVAASPDPPPGEARHGPCPPVVNLREWYPFGMGVPWRAWGLPPRGCEGYIIQRDFPGTVDRKPPTRLQFLALLAQVRSRRPKYIWTY